MPDKLQFGGIYHIYNQGNNRENLFRQPENYRYFLQLFAQHVGPIVQVFAYCLLPNHFHMLLKIREKEEILAEKAFHKFWNLARKEQPHQCFSNFFNAYARAFNKRFGRSGALFKRPFSRKRVDSPLYFQNVLIYIHQNPQKHGLIDDFRNWPFSSYGAIISDKDTRVAKMAVLNWFDGQESFLMNHREIVEVELEDWAGF